MARKIIILITIVLLCFSCKKTESNKQIKQEKDTNSSNSNKLALNKSDEFIESENNINVEELTYEDCGFFYENEHLLLLSEIKKYKSLNLDGAEIIDSFEYLDEKHEIKQKNFDGLLVKWMENNGVPGNILLFDSVNNNCKTKRGISIGSGIQEVYEKYGKKQIHDGEVSYSYGSVEHETEIVICFSIKNEKVERINIQSYD